MDIEHEKSRTRADRLVEKALWFYLWPVVVVMLILNLRVHLTKWPKRLKIKNETFIHTYIGRWLQKRDRLNWSYYK